MSTISVYKLLLLLIFYLCLTIYFIQKILKKIIIYFVIAYSTRKEIWNIIYNFIYLN
jgi:hypothetical protein